MRFKMTGNKRDTACVVIKNDDSIPIFMGGPVVLSMDGTDDGLAVKSVNNLAAALQGMFWGLALTDIAVGEFGEAQVSGACDLARIVTATRAASTDVWASYPAGAIGDHLAPITGTGHGAGSTAADQALTRVGSAAFTVNVLARLGQTYASATTQASSIGGASTASVSTMKVLLRAL